MFFKKKKPTPQAKAAPSAAKETVNKPAYPYHEALDWTVERMALKEKQAKAGWTAAKIMGCLLVLVSIICIVIAVKKEAYPFIVELDKSNGTTRVIDIRDPQNIPVDEMMDKYWLNLYTLSHESYDYRTLDFDTSILEQYRQVNVVAWSMGVWAAPIALASVPKEKLLLIAFNGTITPIGDTDGIPEKTFRDTLSGLTPASLQKFMRRMCKDSNAYKAFLGITPRRDFNEIKEELELIEKKYTQMRGITIDENGNYIYSNDDEMDAYVNDKYQYIDYDYAFIGVNDRIFPLENMKLNFDYMFDDDKLIVADCAHYDEPMFRFLLQDMWSMPIDDFLSHLRELDT